MKQEGLREKDIRDRLEWFANNWLAIAGSTDDVEQIEKEQNKLLDQIEALIEPKESKNKKFYCGGSSPGADFIPAEPKESLGEDYFIGCDKDLLMKKADYLKTTDAEGWAIGTYIQELLSGKIAKPIAEENIAREGITCTCGEKEFASDCYCSNGIMHRKKLPCYVPVSILPKPEPIEKNLSANNLLTIKNCLVYCKHRLIDHPEAGLRHTGCNVGYINEVLKKLGLYEEPRKAWLGESLAREDKPSKIEPLEIKYQSNDFSSCVSIELQAIKDKIQEIIRALNEMKEK